MFASSVTSHINNYLYYNNRDVAKWSMIGQFHVTPKGL